jgi:hypothetical protein
MSGIPPIVERMLIRDRTQDVKLRIVYIDRYSVTCWLCRIDDDSWPYPMQLNRLYDELDSECGNFTIEPNDSSSYRFISSERETATDKRHELSYMLIEPLITGDNERLILSGKERKKMIAARLKEVKSTRQTLCKLLLRYWKRGMTYQALRPDYKKCGGPGSKRNQTDKKIGAPRTITPGTGIGANDEIRRCLQVGADFWLSRKGSLPESVDYIVRLYFSKPIREGNKVIAYDVDPDKKPTVRQLQYYIDTKYPHAQKIRKREGEKNWNLNERALLGMADGDVQGPGDCFQIDATVADVYLVSQFDRRRIVGRPIIYFVLDVYSRLIVGVYVGFEGPSWVGAMMALVNMVTPKVGFCKQYETDINEADWPAHFAPKRIMADKGELMSVKLGKNITEGLKIDIENTSTGRADLKSLVERRFGIVPAIFKQFTPGYVKQDFGERGAKDYRLDAALNLYEFTQMVILAVGEHNFTPIRDKHLPAEMITDGYIASPLDLWHWGILNRSGSLKVLTIDEVALNVMPVEPALVTGKGIKFKSGFYSCPTAISEEWFSAARHQGRKIEVSFDPRDMGILYLRDEKLPNGFEKCQLLDPYIELQGKSVYEAEEKDKAHKINTASGENARQEERILYDKKLKQIETKAKKATKDAADSSIPKSQRIANINEYRSDEKEQQRAAETFHPAGPAEITTSLASANTADIADELTRPAKSFLEFLKNKRQAREIGKNERESDT